MAPILVVGAGTTGLTLACQLARQGREVRIVDRRPAADERCRACLVRVRSLQVLADLGVAQEVVAQAQAVRSTSIYAGHERLVDLAQHVQESAFPEAVCLEQFKTEQALERRLNGLGVFVERSTELASLAQDGDGVRATLRRGGGVEPVEVSWAAGCDGAHSRVRALSGIEFPGERDPLTYLVADVAMDPPLPHDEVAIYVGEKAMMMAFPLPGGRSLLCGGDPLAGAATASHLTLERVQQLARERIWPDVSVTDPRWLGYFHVDYRLASSYRRGRVFLAGDAAHVFSPFGGLGMNTGIQDATNLAWKLGLVERGRAPSSILESYEVERRPVAEAAITSTRLGTEHLKLVAGLAPVLRRAVLQAAGSRGDSAVATRQAEQLDLNYAAGLAGGEDGLFLGGPHPGRQAPDVALVHRGEHHRLADLLDGTTHTLLMFAPPVLDAGKGSQGALEIVAAALGTRHACLLNALVVGGGDAEQIAREPHRLPWIGQSGYVCDEGGELRRAYGVTGEAIYLIRPDGYVAYRGQPATVDGLRGYLERVYG